MFKHHWGRRSSLLAAFILPLCAQAPYTISDNVRLVLLDVSVKDSHAGYVTGLTKADFSVREEGQARPISQFGAMDAPVTVGLVLDNSGSMHSKRREVVQAGLAFAKQSNAADEFFVVNFSNTVVPPPVPFTDRAKTIHEALYLGPAQGQTALYDAIAYSLKHLDKGHLDQRTLIVVSDGGDNVSKISLTQLLDLIEASRATIFTVGLLDEENRDLNPSVLRKIASISGGQYFQPRTMDQIVPVLETISKDIRSRYTLAFAPGDDGDQTATRHIKVVAEKDGHHFKVRTRASYRMRQ